MDSDTQIRKRITDLEMSQNSIIESNKRLDTRVEHLCEKLESGPNWGILAAWMGIFLTISAGLLSLVLSPIRQDIQKISDTQKNNIMVWQEHLKKPGHDVMEYRYDQTREHIKAILKSLKDLQSWSVTLDKAIHQSLQRNGSKIETLENKVEEIIRRLP